MKKFFMTIVATVFLTSCASVTTPVGFSGLYTGVTSGVAATSNNVGTKVGESSATNVLGLFATGDAGIDVAAKKAGIKKISHVDQTQTSILGLFSTYKTRVYGN